MGSIDFNRVNNLQRTLVLQQDELAVTQTDLALSVVSLYRALGGDWQIRHGSMPAAMDRSVIGFEDSIEELGPPIEPREVSLEPAP